MFFFRVCSYVNRLPRHRALLAGATCICAAESLRAITEPAPRGREASRSCGKSVVRIERPEYDFGPVLGRGTSGEVRRCRCRRTGRTVAIKIVPRERSSESSIRHEIDVLQRVALHRSIAQLEGYYETDEAFYLVMEYVAGGELLDHLSSEGGRLTERAAAVMLQQVGGAVALLHAQGLCHGDIKPENLLLTSDGELRLVDFGLSCEKDAIDKKPGTWGTCNRRV
jgi:serine/threonine protein kinase